MQLILNIAENRQITGVAEDCEKSYSLWAQLADLGKVVWKRLKRQKIISASGRDRKHPIKRP
jgi:hypothetical protein